MRLARKAIWDEFNKTNSFPVPFTDDPDVDKFVELQLLTSTTSIIRQIYSIKVKKPANQQAHKLIKMTASEFDQKIPDPETYQRGFPKFYTRWNTKPFDNTLDPQTRAQIIETWPIVEDDQYVMDIRFCVFPRSVANLQPPSGEDIADALDFEAADDIIIALATAILCSGLGKIEKSRHWFSIYEQLFADLKGMKDEDFEGLQAAVRVSQQDPYYGSRGYDDPFVRSTV